MEHHVQKLNLPKKLPHWKQHTRTWAAVNARSRKTDNLLKINKKNIDLRYHLLAVEHGVHNGVSCLFDALHALKPFFKLGKVKRSGQNINVPYPIQEAHALSISKTWIKARIRKTKAKEEALTQELIEIHNQRGSRYKQATQYRQKLRDNRKNLQYRW